MNPSAEIKAVGIAFGGQASQPGKVLPGYQKFHDEIKHAHAHSPQPRLSGSHRRAGLRFDSGSNFFVWQFGSGRNSARAESPSRIVVNA